MPTRRKKYVKRGLNRTEKSQVSKIAKNVVSRKIETKYIDSTYNSGFDTTGTIQILSNIITQGVTDSDRVGDKCEMKSLAMRGYASYGDTVNIMRVILFQWKPSSTTAPVITDILQTVHRFSHYNHDKKALYRVLYDTTFNLNDTNRRQQLIKRTLKLKLKTLKFENAGVNGMNHIYLLGISDSGGVPNPAVQLDFRLTFKDA